MAVGGLVVYFIEEPYELYEYNNGSNQCFEVGREKGRERSIDSIIQVGPSELQIGVDDGSLHRSCSSGPPKAALLPSAELTVSLLESMTVCLEIFRSIPDVVWSGIIASVLALTGVLISNRSNTSRLLIQLQHDATEKAKERTAALRREVYLRAVEELTKANSHLASLPQADLAKTNAAEGLQGFFAAAAKLQLVAEPKTALLVNRLVGSYAELLLRLMERLMPLQSAKSDIVINDQLYEKAQSEVHRVLSEMAKFNESAQVNDLVFSALQRSFSAYQSQANEHASARQAAWTEFNALSANFLRQLLIDMRLIGDQQIPVLIEIRRDLGLTADLEAMRAQMEEQWARMSLQIDKMISACRAQ